MGKRSFHPKGAPLIEGRCTSGSRGAHPDSRNGQEVFSPLRRDLAASESDTIQAITRFRKTKGDLDEVREILSRVQQQLKVKTREVASPTAPLDCSERVQLNAGRFRPTRKLCGFCNKGP